MKKLGKVKTLAIASLSAFAIATPIALAQNAGTGQENKQVSQGEGHGKHRGGRDKRGGWDKGQGREGRGFRGGGGRAGMFRGITLTDDQKTRLQSIHQSFRERTQSLHQQLRAKRQELRKANDGGTFNEALATQKLTETAALQAKLMGERFRLRQEMESVLTAEQKAQIEQKRSEFKANRGQRSGRKVQ